MPSWRVKLLYDGACPFCRREIQRLKQHDQRGFLDVEDISAPAFDPAKYGLTRDEVMGVLHAVLPDGRVVRRLEALRRAYQAVGLGWLVAPTGWPGLHWVFDGLYGAFARHRLGLGQLCSIGRANDICAVGHRSAVGAHKPISGIGVRVDDRQPLLPRKKLIRRGVRPTVIARQHDPAGP
jgi:predicted DCC family thiol-disulfide oxidoreductase YuxK